MIVESLNVVIGRHPARVAVVGVCGMLSDNGIVIDARRQNAGDGYVGWNAQLRTLLGDQLLGSQRPFGKTPPTLALGVHVGDHIVILVVFLKVERRESIAHRLVHITSRGACLTAKELPATVHSP